MIRQIESLRLQGFSFKDIGTRVGCSERTARRYGAGVKPKLQLPGEKPDLASMDPGPIRAALLTQFMEALYQDKSLREVTVVWHRDPDPRSTFWAAEYGNPPSILFLNEAERQLRRALDALGPHSVRMLARDVRSKGRFLRDVVGDLYADYISWHQFQQEFEPDIIRAPLWRPPSERPQEPDIEYSNPFGLPED
ncbi:MAG: hypothetical protein ACRELE_04235 [Gemmatimonadales bacterium]